MSRRIIILDECTEVDIAALLKAFGPQYPLPTQAARDYVQSMLSCDHEWGYVSRDSGVVVGYCCIKCGLRKAGPKSQDSPCDHQWLSSSDNSYIWCGKCGVAKVEQKAEGKA